jgi:hypothetical protein
MNALHFSILFVSCLFPGMVLCVEIGRFLGRKSHAEDAEGTRAGVGAVEGAIFGLLGLLIAFTFSGAYSRFEARRQLIVQEANNIGTAWLRLDLLPAAAQPALRDLFRQYVDSRLAAYRMVPNMAAANSELARAARMQGDIWTQAVAACRSSEGQSSTMLLLPALNQMFDIVTDRTAAVSTHTPVVIFLMLGALALLGSVLAGFDMAGAKRRSWFHILGFAFIMSLTVYVILDLEFPRMGLIRVDYVDQLLVDLRQSMK